MGGGSYNWASKVDNGRVKLTMGGLRWVWAGKNYLGSGEVTHGRKRLLMGGVIKIWAGEVFYSYMLLSSPICNFTSPL